MKTTSNQTANRPIHLTTEIGNPSLCGATSQTTEDNAVESIEGVTCKRCLSKYSQWNVPTAPVISIAVDPDEHYDILPTDDNTVVLPTALPTDAAFTPAIAIDPMTEDELARLDAMRDLNEDLNHRYPHLQTDEDGGWPDAPTPDSRPIGTPDLTAKAAQKVADLAKPKAPKAAKPKNVHLSHAQVNADGTPALLKNGDEAPQTLCRIPGPTTTDPEAVTCKVCLSKMGHHKPTNTIPDEVKTARKAYKGFVARATYMAYMDSNQLGTSWTLTHTNLAGERYQITATGRADGLYLCNNTTAGNTKESLIETIERLGWSCGEE